MHAFQACVSGSIPERCIFCFYGLMVKRFSSKEKIMGSIPIRSYGGWGNQGSP